MSINWVCKRTHTWATGDMQRYACFLNIFTPRRNVAGVVESMSNQMFTSDYIDNTGTLFAVLG
jgi:hypothetical protein